MVSSSDLPDCANSNCNKGGTIMIGTLFFCGPCCRRAMAFKQERDNEYLMQRFSEPEQMAITGTKNDKN